MVHTHFCHVRRRRASSKSSARRGVLNNMGPDGWYGSVPFRREWGTYHIGVTGADAASWIFDVRFETIDRVVTATVDIDASDDTALIALEDDPMHWFDVSA